MLSARKGNAVTQQIRRLIGGVYRVGQVITREGMLTTCTAYNRNTNDVVGLVVIEFLSLSVHSIEQLLQPLASRSIAQSPHVLHIHDWGIDGNRAYIAVDPPRGARPIVAVTVDRIRPVLRVRPGRARLRCRPVATQGCLNSTSGHRRISSSPPRRYCPTISIFVRDRVMCLTAAWMSRKQRSNRLAV